MFLKYIELVEKAFGRPKEVEEVLVPTDPGPSVEIVSDEEYVTGAMLDMAVELEGYLEDFELSAETRGLIEDLVEKLPKTEYAVNMLEEHEPGVRYTGFVE